MKHTYSLVHLTNIACSPPAFIRTAAAAGYDAVSLRTIPMGLPGRGSARYHRPQAAGRDPGGMPGDRRLYQ